MLILDYRSAGEHWTGGKASRDATKPVFEALLCICKIRYGSSKIYDSNSKPYYRAETGKQNWKELRSQEYVQAGTTYVS